MGKTYEKNGHLYEQNDGPFPFGDKDLGELHENWDGSKETRNVFGTNYRIEREEPGFLEEVIETVVPGARPKDREASTSDGRAGRMHYSEWNGRYELELNDWPETETAVQGSYVQNSGSGDRSYEDSGFSSSADREASFGAKVLGTGVMLLIIFAVISFLEHYPPPPPAPPVHPAHDPIYVYVDSNGVKHYTNSKPDSESGAQRVNVGTQGSPKGPAARKKPEMEVIVRRVDENGRVYYINVPESELNEQRGNNNPADNSRQP